MTLNAINGVAFAHKKQLHMETTYAPAPPDLNLWVFSRANKFSYLLASPTSISCAKPTQLRMWKELTTCSYKSTYKPCFLSYKLGFLNPATPTLPLATHCH